MRQVSVVFPILLLTGCLGFFREAGPGPDTPVFVVYVQSPVGGTFTIWHSNEFGAGGGRGGPDWVFQGTGSLQEAMTSWFYDRVDPSRQEISGSYTGDYLVIGFGQRTFRPGGSRTGPGAESNSIRGISGTDPVVSACSIRYGPAEPGGSAYRFEFRLTPASRVCLAP